MIDKSPFRLGTGAVLCMADKFCTFDSNNLIGANLEDIVSALILDVKKGNAYIIIYAEKDVIL